MIPLLPYPPPHPTHLWRHSDAVAHRTSGPSASHSHRTAPQPTRREKQKPYSTKYSLFFPAARERACLHIRHKAFLDPEAALGDLLHVGALLAEATSHLSGFVVQLRLASTSPPTLHVRTRTRCVTSQVSRGQLPPAAWISFLKKLVCLQYLYNDCPGKVVEVQRNKILPYFGESVY